MIRHNSFAATAAAVLLLLNTDPSLAANCQITRGRAAGGIEVKLTANAMTVDGVQRSAISFSTPLPVTTDGAPDSYGPNDLGGRRGINTVCNAITVYPVNGQGDRLRPLDGIRQCQEILSIFDRFRAANWNDPPGYDVAWQDGLVSKIEDDRPIPCVFTSGPYAGFFGSKTNLTNSLTDNAGECGTHNQIDPRQIQGITYQGGLNYIRASGAQLGDLALATYRGPDGIVRNSFAIIVDTGGIRTPAMGTIALNAALLHREGPFDTAQRVKSLAISTPVRVTIIAGSRGFHIATPFTQENITERWNAFLKSAGLSSPEQLIAAADCRRMIFEPRL